MNTSATTRHGIAAPNRVFAAPGRVLAAVLVVFTSLAAIGPVAGQEVTRGDLGRTEKLRILVDKVMQPEEGWVTKEWIVRETAKAGFNVFSPRHGFDRPEEVRQVNQWCKKYGIFHVPWMRGTLGAPSGPAANGRRVLWADGTEQPIWSACSDEFWQWTTEHVVRYAKMRAETDRVAGVFLDYENYWPGGSGNLYYITYEDAVLDPFLAARNIERPKIEPNQRKTWLVEQGLHDAFEQFQIGQWRKRCRRLREEVDKYDPEFRFCIYPAPGTPFMTEACYREWSTPRAPIILADASVYGRPGRFLSQLESLEQNRRKLVTRMDVPREMGIPFIYAGGIDPVVRGADPEFCGKNAVMISELTGGYWVFYEGPKYHGDHADYFRWFTWANRKIEQAELQAWREPRETPEQWTLDVFDKIDGRLPKAPPAVDGPTVQFGTVRLRNENLLLLAAGKDRPVEVVLQDVPVGKYTSRLVWQVRDARGKSIASGIIGHNERQTVRFVPREAGLYLLGLSAGSCAATVKSANVPVAVCTTGGARLIYAVEPVYFHVPSGVERFTMTAAGSRAETVRVEVFDPAGVRVAEGQTTGRATAAQIDVHVGSHDGATWSLITRRADEGVLEDYTLKFSDNIPPVLSLCPRHVFGGKREE